jgi:hypothetical protein
MNNKHLLFALTLALCLLLFWVGTHLSFGNRGEMKMTIRMALNFSRSAKSLDTSEILTTYQYELLRNLYGRLVEYDSDSQLVADIPESLSWSEDEVTFTFGDKVTTIDGHVINAKDAEASLKRLIVKGKSGHGDIRRFLCPDYKLNSIEDPCPGVRTEGNKLILKVVNPIFLPLLLSTLESADYSIIPITSLDHSSHDLSVSDYKNTSGPYYVSEDSDNGALVLRANPHHYHYDIEMPQVVRLVPVDLTSGLSAFLKGEVDFLPTSQFFVGENAQKILEDKSFNVHETLPLRVTVANFAPKGLHDFTPEQRLYAALALDKAQSRLFPQIGSRSTTEFFQAMSDGALTEEQVAQIKAWREGLKPPKFERPIEVKVLSSFVESFKEALKDYPEIKISAADQSAITLPLDQRPELYFVMTDSAWTENFSLLGYNFENSSFSVPGVNTEDWFRDYLATADKGLRIKKLNKLHFDMLLNASIVPTKVTPYYAVSTKTWSLNQSNLSAGTAIWRMRRN